MNKQLLKKKYKESRLKKLLKKERSTVVLRLKKALEHVKGMNYDTDGLSPMDFQRRVRGYSIDHLSDEQQN